jgi:hypothetical protein
LTIKSKKKNKLKARGVQACKNKKTQRLFIQQAQANGNTFIPTNKWILIRDLEKQPTPAEIAVLKASESYYNTIKLAEEKWSKF